MKKLFLILLLTLPLNILPQTKYYIYLKDKGVQADHALQKNSAEYQKALSALSPECIERRKNTLGSDNIITEDDLPIPENFIKQIEDAGIKIENKLKWFNAVTAYLNTGQAEQILRFPFVSKIEKVRTLAKINTLEPDLSKSIIPKTNIADTLYGSSYNQLQLSDIPAVHKKGIKGNGVIVGFLDSGFDWKTPSSLKNSKVRGEYDFVFKDEVTSNQSQDVKGQHDHGTAVFSVVAGYKPGLLIGAAYDASFYLAKTEYIATESRAEEDNMAAALEWMEAKGIHIATTSCGYNSFDNAADSYTYQNMDGKTSICTKAFEKAFSLGVSTFSSAGNEGNNSWKYITSPADGFNIIAVGSVDNSKNLSGSSSRGPTYDNRIKPEVTAQGVAVYSAAASTENSYTYMSGTSLAAPIAAGTAALLLSAYPYLTNTQIRQILLLTAENTSTPNNNIGWGLLSASRAIAYPNIAKYNESFRISKIVFNNSGIVNNLVNISISDDGSVFKTYEMTNTNDVYFRYILPTYPGNKKIYFYFDYTDSLGNKKREPEKLYYSFDFGSTDVKYSNGSASPEDFSISQNYPNPFNGITNIDFIAMTNGNATLKIYDIIGREIKTLYNNYVSKGSYRLNFNLNTLASGVYFYRLDLNGRLITKKMILNK